MKYKVKKYYKDRRAVAFISVEANSEQELEANLIEMSKDGNKYVWLKD